MAQVKFPGTLVAFAPSFRYVVPGLSLRQFKENGATISSFIAADKAQRLGEDVDMGALLEASVGLITLALQRNYPDTTQEQVSEFVDMNNFRDAIQAIMGASGMELTTEDGKGDAPGEA